jgi:hypothetical protein
MIGKHLSNAISKFNDSLKNADKFNDKISHITGVKHDLIDSNAKVLIEEE